MKLNLGCGSIVSALPAVNAGWLYFDLHGWPTHIRGDALALPFKDGAFEAIHCAHLIEHVTRDQAVILASEIQRTLAKDGYAYISAPDAGRTREIQSRQWVGYTRHGGPQEGWDHLWMPTVKRLRALLLSVGLTPSWATGLPQGHPANTHAWPPDLEVRFVCRRSDFPWPTHFPPGVGYVR